MKTLKLIKKEHNIKIGQRCDYIRHQLLMRVAC